MTGSGKERTGKVLVVEDDESTTLYVTRVLRRNGLRVRWALDAEQAGILLREEAFDVLLADYRLVARSGIDLAAEARSLYPAVGIAVMTSVCGREINASARMSGADDVFEKPLHSDNFILRITELVRRSQTPRRGSGGAPPETATALSGPVGTVPAVSSSDDDETAPGNAESGPGEQALARGSVFAWGDTDRTSGSGGPCGAVTGGVSRARFSALLAFESRGVSAEVGSDRACSEPADSTERHLRARAWHPSSWPSAPRRVTFTMWASAAPGVTVSSAVCGLTSLQMHTSPCR